jgi:hypothetical protein
VPVYLEVAPKRTFASAIEWPGWSRSGKTAEAALEALAAAGPRYRQALGSLARALTVPADVAGLEVRETVDGGSGTDYGVPSRSPSGDDRPVAAAELELLSGILRAGWAAWDRAAKAAEGHELTTGPRGGGRSLEKMRAHVRESEWAYLQELGGRFKPPKGASDDDVERAIRTHMLALLEERVRGVEPPMGPRRVRPWWTPRYLVRRSAWHALDHAWELEDRVI